jgi:hypothetical protein
MVDHKPNKDLKVDLKSNQQPRVDKKSSKVDKKLIKGHKGSK